MFFSKKKDNDMEKIKNALNNDMNFHDLSQLPDIDDMPEMPAPTFAPEPRYTPAPRAADYEPQSAPLFVKVDKYKELLSGIHEMRLYISSTKQVFTLLQDTETIRSDALKVLRATIQRMEKSLIEVDAELLRPRGADFPQEDTGEVRQMESSLNELQRQLSSLKKELQDLK